MTMSKKKRYSLNLSYATVSPVLPRYPSNEGYNSPFSAPATPMSGNYQDLALGGTGIGIDSSFSSRRGTSGHSSFYRISSSEIGHVSMDSIHASATANIKLILIGDAGVGKTAMILAFYNELPTKGQLKLMKEVSSPSISNPDKRRIPSQRRIISSKGKLRKKPSMNSMKKRYSLNDYEELFNKKSPINDDINFSFEDDKTPDGNDDDSDDELVIDTSSTIGIDIKTTTVNIDNRFFKCITWDTAGQERYKNAMIPSLYKGSNGIFLAYDISDIESFRSCCDHWLVEALENLSTADLEKARFYLIGNKIDIYKQRQVTHGHVLEAISEIEFKYEIKIFGNFEVTCKWPNVVERTFNLIIKDLVEHGCYDDKEYKDTQQQVETELQPHIPEEVLHKIDDVNSIEETQTSMKTDTTADSEEAEYNDMVSESDSELEDNGSDSDFELNHRNQSKNSKNPQLKDENSSTNDEIDKVFPKMNKIIDISKPLSGDNYNDGKYSPYPSCCA